MRQFTVRNLKQSYIQGELEPFCDVLEIDIEEFERAEGWELYFITDDEMKKLKERKIFPEWVEWKLDFNLKGGWISMLVVNIEMMDGSKLQEAFVFDKNEVGAKALQNFNDLRNHLNKAIKKEGMLHYNTRFMSGSIVAKFITGYEIKQIDSDTFKSAIR